MGTIAQNTSLSGSHAVNHSKSDVASDFWDKVESIRFGLIPLLFIIVPCMAGIASSSALFSDNMFLFAVAGIPAMIVETLILGMASMKSVVISSVVSCVVSILVYVITFIG